MAHDAGSTTPTWECAAQIQYLTVHGILEREKRNDDLRTTCKFEVQFWATGYYVSTVGLNTATVQKYIREQEKQDQIEDSLSRKEYKSPFKVSK